MQKSQKLNMLYWSKQSLTFGEEEYRATLFHDHIIKPTHS